MVAAPALDAEADVKKFRETKGLTYPMIVRGEALAQAFRVEAYPTMFLLDKEGKVAWKGHFKDAVFLKTLEALLK